MKKETKRQHYVPRTYLKKFAVPSKKSFNIGAVEKNNLENIIFPNISNVCLETDLYTLSGETETERQALEVFYSKHIESDYDSIFNILINDSITEISEEIHRKIITTVITMLYRTSKWIHEHNNVFNRALEQVYNICIQTGKKSFDFEGEKFSIEGKTLKDIQQEFADLNKEGMVLAQLKTALKLINIRKYDGIMVVRYSYEDKLITSDNPVILSNSDGSLIAPFDPENIIRLPINTNHQLTIMPHSQSDGSHRIVRLNYNRDLSEIGMIANNSSQFENSYKYILGPRKALSTYIENKEIYEKPYNAEKDSNT